MKRIEYSLHIAPSITLIILSGILFITQDINAEILGGLLYVTAGVWEIWATAMRLKDLNFNKWLCVAVLIPPVNLVILGICFFKKGEKIKLYDSIVDLSMI